MQQCIDRRDKKIEKLREALVFYAGRDMTLADFLDDYGRLARQTLEVNE
jgi:hypothetical protein